MAGFTFPAQAASVTLVDTYFGGLNQYNNPNDIIGPAGVFGISSAVVERVGVGGNTLQVTINTPYAGVPGTAAAESTGYGALFLNPLSSGGWTPTGSGPNYSTDVYQAGDWKYAFTIPKVPSATTGTGHLYDTSTGTIVMSNVNGNPVSAPNPGNPGFYFRQNQAVQFTAPANNGLASGTWTIDAANDAITFSIIDNHLLGDTFALSWAMTCANDIIQGLIRLPVSQDPPTQTPLPAALPLFASGAGVMAFIGWRRKRRTAKAAVA